ncbi:MAG: hypothetical protein IKC43_02665 [Clostridia bacterium]|nr:hypothetical protein [Clostridia bacterium]
MFWYEKKAEGKDVCVSTRVRLARNLKDFPFKARLTDEKAAEIVNKLFDIYNDQENYTVTTMQDIGRIDAESLAERHYISRDFAKSTSPRLLVRDDSRDIAIMVGEEDHLRIQCIKNGYALEEAFRATMEEEAFLDSRLDFAFSESLGYLTHCPTNLGTALRISVMMHLPALTAAGRMEALTQQLQKIGVTVRGLYGEGSRADAALYQISNQVTMGITEEETLRKMSKIIGQIADTERAMRTSYDEETSEKLLDRAQRSEGILRTARLVSSSEFLSLYNAARLGCMIGNTSSLTPELLDSLLFAVMPATMELAGYRDTATTLPKEMQRDKNRAVLIQKTIAAYGKGGTKKTRSTPSDKERKSKKTPDEA